MDEQRLQAYQQLIQQLLSCPNGEEPEILAANTDLIDDGFLQALEAVAEDFAQQGNENNAGWLRNLATQLGARLNRTTPDVETYGRFLVEVLQTTADSDGDAQVVYPLLAQNTDKLDDNFAEILRHWATNTLAEAELETAKYNARVIFSFSSLIQQFPLGDKASNMEIAITGYEIALTIFTRADFPQNWAATQNNLGIAYSDRIRGDKAENLEQAIAAYENALEVRTRTDFPVDWAGTQNNLGIAYSNKIRGDKAQNLESAIAAYTQALEVRTRTNFPVDWATTQNNLATAYGDRIRGDKAENLEQAIAAYSAALEVRNRTNFPVDWAMTQNNLATAYGDRIRGDKAENLEQAIAVYSAALEVRNRTNFPVDWAMTQNNLAAAYLDRIRGDKAENLEQAIAAYTQALEVYTRTDFPVQWATTQNNLAIAYSNRIRGDKAENLEQAITAYTQALEVRTRTNFLLQWATTQNNLGSAYRNRIRGDKAENLEQAIKAYTQALEVRTRTDFPVNWAATQNNLGTAYLCRIRGDKAQNLEKAIKAYSASLEIRTRLDFPQNHAETLVNLGMLYQDELKEFTLAESIFAAAIDTVENLRGDIVSGEESKRKQAEQWNQLFRRMVEVCLALGKQTTAIEYIERSKTRNLAELIAADQPFNHIQYPEIQNLLDHQTAIIQFYIFNDCFRAFIITRDNEKPQIWQSNSQDLEKLVTWIINYLELYIKDREGWQNTLNDQLIQLGGILHIEEIISLIPLHCQRLILIPHRYLHLLPLHALPVHNSYLLDLFSQGVGYAPSCQLLQQIHNRQRTDFQSFFAIQTPTIDLYETDLGAVTTIKNQFKQTHIFKQNKAKKSTILSINPNNNQITTNADLRCANSIFFFCHGNFEFNSPLESGLQLADENLTLADIINHLKLENCRLVTLSGCETGLIDPTNTSDEYIGLPSGFFLAGSNNVVSSLWIVSATATALLTIKFYQELQQQNNITLALNTAQRWLRNTTAKEFRGWLSNSSLNLAQQTQLDRYFAKIATNDGEDSKPFASPHYWSAFCAIGKGV